MPAARLLRLIGLRPFRRRPAWRGAASGRGPAAWAGRGLQRGGVSPFARRGPSPVRLPDAGGGALSDDGPAVGVFLSSCEGWRLASRFMRSRRSSSVSRHWRRVFSGVSMPWLAAWWCQRTVWARLEALCATSSSISSSASAVHCSQWGSSSGGADSAASSRSSMVCMALASSRSSAMVPGCPFIGLLTRARTCSSGSNCSACSCTVSGMGRPEGTSMMRSSPAGLLVSSHCPPANPVWSVQPC